MRAQRLQRLGHTTDRLAELQLHLPPALEPESTLASATTLLRVPQHSLFLLPQQHRRRGGPALLGLLHALRQRLDLLLTTHYYCRSNASLSLRHRASILLFSAFYWLCSLSLLLQIFFLPVHFNQVRQFLRTLLL